MQNTLNHNLFEFKKHRKRPAGWLRSCDLRVNTPSHQSRVFFHGVSPLVFAECERVERIHCERNDSFSFLKVDEPEKNEFTPDRELRL